jgi:mono/diheme cytochrome c family protein
VSGLRLVARGKALAATAVALLAGGIAAGCDTQEEADLERGRDLFTTGCGSCHVLAEAATAGISGPDLDASFAQARADGMDQDTIEGVVEAQIENPRPTNEGDPDYANQYMPEKIYEGSDAADVSAYVASVAGVPGIEPPPLGEPPELFAEQCGTCHILESAGTAGVTGPKLDDVLPGQDAEMITQSIRDPQAEISPGFAEPSAMPQYTDTQIPDENLQELVDYLITETGGEPAESESGSGEGGKGTKSRRER